MANINENYLNLQGSYLFANIAKKVADYQAAHPDAERRRWLQRMRWKLQS